MFISIDLSEDVLRALDQAVAARVAAREYPAGGQKRAKPRYRALTPKERGKAAQIAQKEGAAAANAWIKATTLESPGTEGEAPPRRVGRPRDFPSRRLLIEEALRQVFMPKKEA